MSKELDRIESVISRTNHLARCIYRKKGRLAGDHQTFHESDDPDMMAAWAEAVHISILLTGSDPDEMVNEWYQHR